MIAYIRGVLAEKDPGRVIVEAAGVGYEMLISLNTFDALPRKGEEVKLLAWHCVREDDEALYGFSAEDEREMFMKLTQVSGVGPKIALAILSGSSIGELSLAIASGMRALWNFTPYRIKAPDDVVIANTSIYAHLAIIYNRMHNSDSDLKQE